MLVATLVKPTARWLIARIRRRAREQAPSAIVLPIEELLAQEFLEAAATSPLDDPDAGLQRETADELAGRSMVRTVIIIGALAALIAVSAWAITTVIRRRRLSEAAESQAISEPVAIPVEVPVEEPEEAVALGTPIE
jgi:hypothetical protein